MSAAQGGRLWLRLTFAADLAPERSHVEARFDLPRDELCQTRDKTLDERRQHGEIVRRLERRRQQRVVLPITPRLVSDLSMQRTHMVDTA